MKNAENIEYAIKNMNVSASPELHNKVLNSLLSQMEETEKQDSVLNRPSIWRIMMKNRITKYAASLIIVAGIAYFFTKFHSGSGITSMAFADVAENICEMKTLTFLLRDKEEGPPTMKFMIIHPHLFRLELMDERTLVDLSSKVKLPEATIFIADTRQGKAVMLNPEKKKAIETTVRGEMLSVYDTFRNFHDLKDFTITEMGMRRIEDRQAFGYKLKNKVDSEIIVWADSKTKLPILIELTTKNLEGQIEHAVYTDIVFDMPLDKSLFSMVTPFGYQREEIDHDPVNRLKSAVNMNRILKACQQYVKEHNGCWPDNLGDLIKYGINKENLANPRLPSREIGYAYVKPPVSPPKSRIVLYEACTSGLNGINIGLANYQVQLIEKEAEFIKRLQTQDKQ